MSFLHCLFKEYFDENTKSYLFFCCEGYRYKSKSSTVIMCIICMMSLSVELAPGTGTPEMNALVKLSVIYLPFMLKSQIQLTLTTLCLHTVALPVFLALTFVVLCC